MIVATIIIVLLVLFIVAIVLSKKAEADSTKERTREVRAPIRTETFTPGIVVHNLFPLPVKVYYVEPKNVTLIGSVPGKTTVTLPKENVVIEKGNKLRFHTAGANNSEIPLYSDFTIIDPELKELYLGQTTSKMLMYETPVYFGGGSHEITLLRLINDTSLPLTFNGHINLPPKSSTVYGGSGSFAPSGLPIGFTLKNDQGVFDDFVLDREINQVRYGVLSTKPVDRYQGKTYN